MTRAEILAAADALRAVALAAKDDELTPDQEFRALYLVRVLLSKAESDLF